MENTPRGGDLGSSSRTTNDTARQVKETVRDTTQQVASAAKDQARSAYEQKKNVVFTEVGNLASALRDVGSRLRSDNGGSMAAQLTDRVAERLEAVSTQLSGKDLDGIVRDVESFGRRNPAVFLGAAAALGFLAIRFVKSSGRPSFDDQWTSSASQRDIASSRSPLVSHAEEL